MSLKQAKKMKKLQENQSQQSISNQQTKQEKQIQQQEQESDNDDYEVNKKDKNFFQLMGDDENSDENNIQENSDNDKEDNSNKQQDSQQNKQQNQEDQQQQVNQKKNKKNKKQKKKLKQQEEQQQLDKILQDLNINQKPTEESKQDNQQQSQIQQQEQDEEIKLNEFQKQIGNITFQSPIQMVLSKLNYIKELQRYFKNVKVVEDNKEDIEDELPTKDKRLARFLKRRKPNNLKNFNLVYNIKHGTPMPEKFQLSCIGQNSLQQRLFSFTPTKKYLELQEAYESMKNTYDPQMIFDFVQQNPYYVEGIYDIGEFFRLQGNFKQANGLLEQILYIYEDCFTPEFRQIFDDTQNKFCLSYDHNQYSKTLFMALLKFIDMLGKKGCFRSALEYSKFLLKLNPSEDPVGALFCIDYNALSSKQYDYLIYFIKNFAVDIYKKSKYSIRYLPNYIYSAALAKFSSLMFPPEVKKKQNQTIKEKKPESTVKLDDLLKFSDSDFDKAINFETVDHLEESQNVLILVAMLLYPQLILNIGQKNEFQKVTVSHSCLQGWQKKNFKDMFSHSYFTDNKTMPFYSFLQLQNDVDIEGLNKIFEIYVERSKIVWKNNTVILWIKAAVGFLLNKLDDQNLKFDYTAFVEKICQAGSNMNILPFSVGRYKILHKSNFSDHIERLDLNNIQDNQAQQQQNPQQQQQNLNPVNANQGFLGQFFSSMLPWVGLPQQNQQANQIVYQDDDVQIEEQDYQDEEDQNY